MDSKHEKPKGSERKRRRHTDTKSPSTTKKLRTEIVPAASSSSKPKEAPTTTTTADANNPFHLVTTSLYLPIAPKYSFWPTATYTHLFNNPDPSKRPSSEQSERLKSFTPLNGVKKDHLDPLLMSFYEPVGGIVIAYNNVRFHPSGKARIAGESPFAFIWVAVDFLVWRPRKGMVLRGWVNLMSASHVGLLVENTWNVSVPREKIPEGWTYHERREGFVPERGAEVEAEAWRNEEEEGGWMDEGGKWVQGLLRFRVEEVRATGHIFSMVGSLLDREGIEVAVLPREGKKKKEKKEKKEKE
ncbi:hypothetical protein RUND412_000576 [Rhizina undulata]